MLEGTRVLDLTWVLGGPFAGQLLAQLGAEVVKVEPLEGDSARKVPPHFYQGESSFFLSVNRGKQSVTLDLKSPEGRTVFYDLVRHSDAVLYGFRPDVPEKLGIDHQSLAAVNPRICVGQLIGLHDDDAHASVPAFDLIVQALGGLMSITGEAGAPPARAGYQVADLAGGLYLALAVVAALHEAQRTGVGRHTQVSLLDCQLSLLTWQAQNYLLSGETPEAAGSRHQMIAPSEAFQGSDGVYFVISPTGEAFWALFCDALGRPDLATDARFVTAADRIASVEQLSAELTAHFSAKPAQEWVDQLASRGVPAALVLSVPEALDHPVARLRQMVEHVTEPTTGGTVSLLGNPIKTPGHPPAALGYPPAVGADTARVLADLCGYSAEHVEALLRGGVVGGDVVGGGPTDVPPPDPPSQKGER